MMIIRQLKESELKSALEFIWKVFVEFKDEDCKEKGLETFRKHIDYNANNELFVNGKLYFYGCFDNEKLIGIISIRDQAHLSMLYVDGDYQRKGIAQQLFITALEKIKSDDSIRHITVNSSHYAIGFYHKIGFIDADKEQVKDEIRFTQMIYRIK